MRRFSSGDRLADRYTLSALLGEGSVADVWLAEDVEANYQVALKLFREPGKNSTVGAENFRSEWQTLRALNHPHIVRAFDYSDSPLPFFAQYYVDGIALAAVGREDWRVVVRPVLLICRAVSYLHQREVFHGDITAANVLMDHGGAPFLIDFGSARRGDFLVGCSGGTPAAMSPERLAGDLPGRADDVYALGVLLTEIISGSSGENALKLIDARNDVPASVVALLRSMVGAAADRPHASTVETEFAAVGIQPGPLPAALIRDYTQDNSHAAPGDSSPYAAIEAVALSTGRRTIAPQGGAPTDDRKTGVSRGLVAAALAGLLAIVVWVVIFLPQRIATTADAEGPGAVAPGVADATPESESQVIEEEIEFSEGSYDDSGRTDAVRLKNATDRTLGELLTKQEVLEVRAVKRWAAARYEAALTRYEQGDRYYLANDYEPARVAYRETIDVFDALLSEIEDEFLTTRERATEALLAGNSREAEKLFELALAITASDIDALSGLERAQNLDDVLMLTDAALDAESGGDFEAALTGFDKALQLDSAWEPAATGRERVTGLITDFRFRSLMTTGFDALNAGRLAEAGRAFRQARTVMPGSSEPLDGLQQVDQASKLGSINRLTAEATRAESEEDWDRAARVYQKILDQDKNVLIAQEGLQYARSRVALDKQLVTYIADPDSLSQAPIMTAAAGLLTRLAKISPQGPRLTEQKGQLAQLLKRAVNPIEVHLISDALTDVALYKVGKLGRFESTALELRPGTYTVVGSRPGYKDVRLQFRVAPEIEIAPVVVRCEEPI